jgi:diguanylate cyclase
MNSNPQPDLEKLLLKLTLQFAIYSKGSSEMLDPHLLNIMQLLKKGVNYQKLIPELVALSKTLVHVTQSEEPLSAKEESDNQFQQTYFITRLNKLLDETEIPFEFDTQCKQLKNKTKSAINEQSYKEIVDLAMALLIKIKNQSSTNHQVIESFLADVSNQLSSLDEQTNLASDSNTQSIENRGELNQAIDLHVDNIKNSAAKAKELSSLQQLINQHLQELSSQLHQHQETEDDRQLETQKQLNLMSQKLQDMENEADSLRNNLKIAHDRALRDALTGLPNRLAYDERIELEFKHWQRYQTPLSLIIWDIDLFKIINDTFGHKAGDKTLTLVARLILNNCRETDFIARFGGEEFTMLLPNTTSDQALEVAENIRKIIAKSGFNYNSKSISLTISCGISEYVTNDQHETVFERADQALYLSKEQGRNKCSIIKGGL